jgi:signal transduction histidine kinase
MSAELSTGLVELGGAHEAAIAGLQAAPVGIAITSLAGSLQYANDTFREIFGISVLDCYGSDINEATRGLLGQDFLTAVARGTRPRQTCVKVEGDSGARMYLCTATRVMHGAVPIYLSVVAQEITELHGEYRERMQLLRALLGERGAVGAWNWLIYGATATGFRTSPVAWISDADGLFGRARVPQSFDAWVPLIVPQHRERFVSAIATAIAEQASYSVEYELSSGEGAPRRMRSIGRYVPPDHSADGRLVCIEVELAAASGRDRNAVSDVLLQHIELPVVWIDRGLRYRYFNDAFATLAAVAWSRNPAIDQEVLPAIQEPTRRRYLDGVLRRALKGESIVFESEILDDRGDVCQWIDFHCKPTRDESGEIDGIAVLGYDISPVKRASLRHQHLNFELRQRLDRRAVKVEAANRTLSSQVAIACNALRERSEQIQAALTATAGAEGSDAALRSAQSALEEMQTQIAGLAKLASVGMRTPERRAFSMNRCVQDVLRDLNFMHEGRSIVFDVRELPDVKGDKLLVKQVLQNLLSNAIKFTREVRQPIVRVSAEERESVTVWSVADNGPGFDPLAAERMFSAFDAHGASLRGVGLSVAWWAIQQLNGRIWCESAPGNGSAFHFTIGDLGDGDYEDRSSHRDL